MPFLALFGCASRDCKPDTNAIRSRAMSESREIAASLQGVARGAEGRSVNVLVLSGGGSRGAFGVGVLSGWREASSPRPVFQVVTGVSTGALQCSHAFLGKPEDDAVLARIYSNVTDREIFSKRFFLSLLWSDSLSTLEPLRRLIAKEITDEVIDRVATEGSGRGLYCATSNIDTGLIKIWNLTEIASKKQYDLYRDVLLASSSVPGLYPPVMLNDCMHFDGGVREQMFLRSVLVPLAQAKDSGVHVFVIVNGKLGIYETCTQPGLFPIIARSLEVLTSASGAGSLEATKKVADSIGASWKLARIPEWLDVPFDAQTFIPKGMKDLYDAGFEWGKRGEWEDNPPPVEDSARAIGIGEGHGGI